ALGPRRDQVLIATKFGMKVDEQRQGAKPEYVKQACEASLRRLQTDRIDLYQIHRPDPQVPVADTLGALNDLVQAGKVPETGWGSNMLNDENLARVEQLIRFAEARGHPILELAFSWLLARPVVASVIAGATSPEQVRSNAAAVGWRLTPTELAEIDKVALPA